MVLSYRTSTSLSISIPTRFITKTTYPFAFAARYSNGVRSVCFLNILEKFLSDLKAGDRDIFVRRYWYMDNIKDIAKRHGCSETKIKSSLFRSRNKLWEEVKEII